MSLLLDALKRAELAKQRQQASDNDTTLPVNKQPEGAAPDVPTGSPQGAAPVDVGSAPEAGPAVPRSHEGAEPPLMTKDRLPVLDQPVEIVAESARRGPSSRELSLEETVPPSPSPSAGVAPGATAPAARPSQPPPGARRPAKPWESSVEDRDTARQLFEVKQMDYNPRRPFYMTLAALGVIAIGTGVYFWWEMQPHSNFMVASQVRPSVPTPTAVPTPVQPEAPRPEQLATAAAPVTSAPASALQPTTDSLPASSQTASGSVTSTQETAGPALAGPMTIHPSQGVVNPLIPLPTSTANASASSAAAGLPSPQRAASPSASSPATTVAAVSGVAPSSPQPPALPLASSRPATAAAVSAVSSTAGSAAHSTPADSSVFTAPAPPAQPVQAARLPLSRGVASSAPPAARTHRQAEGVPPAPSGIPARAIGHPKESQQLAASTKIRVPENSSPAPATAAEPLTHTIQVTHSERRIDPNVESAYTAFSSGNLQAARQAYQKALDSDPSNRDALLGLAAVDVRTHDYQGAAALYARVLEVDPRDPVAQAGLLGLRTNIDPVEAESHLKTLLAAGPDVPVLEFSLGNQYAAQARWSEAQAAYFKAYSTEPDNPDFAFNLAVSLDQLRHSKLALDYYQKAIALAVSHQASFDRDQALTRVRELSPKQAQ